MSVVFEPARACGPGRPRQRLLAALVAAAAMLTPALLTGSPAVAAPPVAASPATDTRTATTGNLARPHTVVLTLRPAIAATPDPARAPANAAERRDRASRSTPSERSRAYVVHWLETHRFDVTATTPWTVTATGPTHLLTRRLPVRLRRMVQSVVRDRAESMQARAVPAGFGPPALRSAYAVDGDGAGTTVATIQFSGWQQSDAEVFARATGITLQPGQLTTEPVAGANPTRPDGMGGDFEVALDVQAILGAAPAARQRIFVAPNTARGAIAVYDAVATAAERDGLTAVSISWGACEPETAPSLITALESSLARMVAAGATVTAASGDAGAYGCATDDQRDDRLATDYPASSPHVLAIGGTSLRRRGDDWSETAWSQGSSGSGGGLSARFPRPAFQDGTVAIDRRAVPDLAVVADPKTGIGIYGPDLSGRRSWQVAGGTSAGAPQVAGQLASTASTLGRTLGFGLVHVPVYASPVGLRDVVAGGGRHRAGPGHDLVTGLGAPQWRTLGSRLQQPALTVAVATDGLEVNVAGYVPAARDARYGIGENIESACQQATSTTVPDSFRLGAGADRRTEVVLAIVDAAGCRTTSRPLVLDRTAPTSSSALTRTNRPGVLALRWGGGDPQPSSGVKAISWKLVRLDTGAVLASADASRPGSRLQAAPRGVQIRLDVETRDALGHVSGVVSSPVVVG